jgi:hypothetical protein
MDLEDKIRKLQEPILVLGASSFPGANLLWYCIPLSRLAVGGIALIPRSFSRGLGVGDLALKYDKILESSPLHNSTSLRLTLETPLSRKLFA